MVVVILTAGGALLLLRAYNGLPDAVVPEGAIASIKQGAAVLAALCASVFAVLAALATGKPPSFGLGSSSSAPTFTGRTGLASV
jgi:hypothetical protein